VPCSDRSGSISVCGGSCEARYERQALVSRYVELRQGPEVFAARGDRRLQLERIGAGRGHDASLHPSHPWHDRAVIEADDELHPHGDTALEAFDYSNDMAIAAVRRHQVNHPGLAVGGLEIRFEY